MNDYDIEAHGRSCVFGTDLQQQARRADDPGPFARVNARRGAAILVARACAYLHDHYDASLAGNKVDLAQATSEVSLQDAKALRGQMASRDVFRCAA
jgi:hypothetical protein